jgi:hypothetical protein
VTYLSLLADLAINLSAVFVLAFVIYYRRHRRRDLVLAYVALNVGLFVVVSMLTTSSVDMALGFGLFAILSIIRLRSDAITQEEVAYYFVTLVMGLVNGLRLEDRLMTVLLNVSLLAVMYVVDNRRFLARTQRRKLTLDTVIDDPDELVADIERRVRGRVVHHVVDHVDYVLEVTVVDVRFIADPASVHRPERRGAVRLAPRGGIPTQTRAGA